MNVTVNVAVPPGTIVPDEIDAEKSPLLVYTELIVKFAVPVFWTVYVLFTDPEFISVLPKSVFIVDEIVVLPEAMLFPFPCKFISGVQHH